MSSEVQQWEYPCITWQTSTLHRQTLTVPGTFLIPVACFKHVQLGMVDHLLSPNGVQYLLTCVDTLTRWSLAVPLQDVSSEIVTRTFSEAQISFLCVLVTVMTDGGPHFTFSLFLDRSRFPGASLRHNRLPSCSQ